MSDKTSRITFFAPRVEGSRIFFSWEPHPLFSVSGYSLEYADLPELRCPSDALLEAYLPMVIAFSFLGDVAFVLPGPVAPRVLKAWEKTCRDTSLVLAKREARVQFIVPQASRVAEPGETDPKGTALLFGGGCESLLTLARLLDEGVRPFLISLWGKGWQGSDPELNRDRFILEEKVRQENGLRVVRIHTDFRRLFDGNKNFRPLMPRDLFITNAALFLPFNISAVLPVAEQLGVGRIVSGNEKENGSDDAYYCFSPQMTGNLCAPGRCVRYRSALEEMTKIQTVNELHLKHPRLARHQYSCWKSVRERWCLNCEKCLRNYVAYKILGVDPASVGMDEAKILDNLPAIVRKIRKSYRRQAILAAFWSGIRREAAVRGKRDVARLIDSFSCPLSFRRFFSRGSAGGACEESLVQ